jgi:hypothetical protein
MLYCYNDHFNVYLNFESQEVLDRYNFLAIVPNSGGSCFEDAAWHEREKVECGCVTKAMLAQWDFIQAVYDVGDDEDWIAVSNALQPQEVWDNLDGFIFTQIFPLFSEEQDEY